MPTEEVIQNAGSVWFLTGPLRGNSYPMMGHSITLGSDPGNDIVISNDPAIAPFHARLLRKNGIWHIEKHPQASALIVNKSPITASTLGDHTLVEIGTDTSFLISLHRQEQKEPSDTLTLQAPTARSLRPEANATQLAVSPGTRLDETEIAPLSSLGLPTIEISSNAFSNRQVYVLDKPVTSIGRSSSNDIAIPAQCVSAQHMQIVREGNQFVLIHPHQEREKTLNGLLYQGRKIRGDEHFRKVLTQGDIFRIGNENGTFVTITYHDRKSETEDELPPVRPISLRNAEVTIGRLPDNEVVLAHPQVSAHHARLLREGGTYRIIDLNSTNHIYVNGQQATNHLLRMSDEIRIGPYRLIFEGNQLAQYDESNFIRLDALNLKKYGHNRTTLLNNISLSIAPRKFVAIVGGSGAGKSTLLGALSGLRPADDGQVLYNGQDYYRNLAAFSAQIGYVPQDDIVHRDLTVERALYYAAKMRLPKDFTHEQIQQRIEEVLEDVEIAERRNLLIRKLSGGQRKRVSIALELLANPPLFFLDEPTSGLDPGLDRKMMFLLRKLADKGHTIILVTHATSNISTCDYVCFLAQGGLLAYFGPPDQAKIFFNRDDFAEIYSNLEATEENRDIPEEAELHFRTSKDYQTYVAQPLRDVKEPTGKVAISAPKKPKATQGKRSKRGNPWKQFILLSMRHVELLKNNASNLSILLLQAPLVALLLMLLVRFEIGGGILSPGNIVQCQTEIITSSGPLALPNISTLPPTVDCSQIVTFLNTDPDGMQYAQAHGGTNQALQNFIVPADSGDAQRVIFLISFFAVLFGTINGTREIVKEAAIYQRERAVNLGIVPYLLSKITVLGILALLQSASMLLILYAFEPFSQSVFLQPFIETYITLALAAIAGVILGLLISAASPNDDTANSLLPIVIIPQVIFAGSIIPLKDWFTQGMAALFPSRWALTALGTSFGLHSDKIDGGKLFGNDPTYHGTLYSIYTQADGIQRIALAWIALAATILVLTALTGIFLKRKDVRG
ncbi:MAG TPA: FHA domain-containing protein [Ktedonobacteraceae bacterium]|nr:FHA domain-containing protein [Ktedonobacteraceae bacterium]